MSNVEWDAQVKIGAARARAAPKHVSEAEANRAKRMGAEVTTDKKSTAGNKAHVGPDHQKIAKLDRENEVAPPPKVSLELSKVIARARTDAKLSQKEFAAAINEPATLISDYEAGRAVPNPQLLGKMERKLKVKLRGKDIGQPLPERGAK